MGLWIVLNLVLASGCSRKTNSSIKENTGARPIAQRIVTLTPSLTEIVFALGAGDRIVGVSDFCDYPPEAQRRPRVGSFLQPSVEKILALRPDLVLVDVVQKEVAEALRHAGARVRAVPLNDLADVRSSLLTVGDAIGDRREQAQQLGMRLDQELLAVRLLVGKRPPRPALFVVDRQLGGLRGLVVAGPGSYLDELLRMAGGENVVADLRLRYAKIAAETITERRPEVILDAVHVPPGPDEAAAQKRAQSDWQQLGDVPAVQRGAVYVLSSREFVTPGPRLGQVLRRIAELLHPEAFPKPAPPARTPIDSTANPLPPAGPR
ncbi:MAG: helical backbone metal receptor [Polyangia bacterium]